DDDDDDNNNDQENRVVDKDANINNINNVNNVNTSVEQQKPPSAQEEEQKREDSANHIIPVADFHAIDSFSQPHTQPDGDGEEKKEDDSDFNPSFVEKTDIEKMENEGGYVSKKKMDGPAHA
ncbi:hypothetical protein RFI_21322, partial [Reticulomyxa filosa]